MKNLIILIIVLIAVVGCNSLTTESPETCETFKYSIDLNIKGLKGPVILLDRTTHEPIQTIYSRTPEFKMEGELPLDKMHATFVLHFPSKYSNPYFYPTKSACAVNFEIDTATRIVGHYDSLLFAKTENNHMNAVKAFKEKNFPAIVKFDHFNMNSLKTANGKRRSREEQKAYAEQGNALLKALTEEIMTKAGKYAQSEEMVVILAEWGGQVGAEKLDSLTGLLSPTVKNTAAYERIIALSDYMKKQAKPEALKVNDKAPDFLLPDAEGNMHSLASFKGKYLVIDFWASWCGPCKKEMPFMKELYKKYHPHGLEMLAVSTDREQSAWIAAIKKLNMPYLQLHDDKGLAAKSYKVSGIPYVLLVNPQGIITAIERGEELEKKIKEQLKL